MTAGTDNTLTQVQPLTVAALSLDIAKGNPAENLRRSCLNFILNFF